MSQIVYYLCHCWTRVCNYWHTQTQQLSG